MSHCCGLAGDGLPAKLPEGSGLDISCTCLLQHYSLHTLQAYDGHVKHPQELGLPVGAHIPMLGFIGRLDYQKGVDLIHENHGWLMGEGVQLILLGSGRADLEQALR